MMQAELTKMQQAMQLQQSGLPMPWDGSGPAPPQVRRSPSIGNRPHTGLSPVALRLASAAATGYDRLSAPSA